MKTVRYSASGGRMVAAVQVAPKRDGSYELMLWEKETNEVVDPFPHIGNFLNNDDDEFPLPRPNAENDGRAWCSRRTARRSDARRRTCPKASPITNSRSGCSSERERRLRLKHARRAGSRHAANCSREPERRAHPRTR